ncbi:MAG: glycosyltransferase family 39 protein [Flavobacteriaceae bacterium]|nr:glycosyltransferase family 39 protein [Flavobacteriaceae bacterium]
MFKKPEKILMVFLLMLLVVNLFQGAFTNLLYDEAYYWYFAQNLDWGYFDHPPMVALWIFIGNLFFDGTLGIRLISSLSFVVTFWLIWKMIDHPDKKQFQWLFILIVSGMALFNTYGFFMVPDTPLVFFGALFLYAYKRFLEENAWRYALLLSVSMAGLMYSKYHGVLLIFFVLLSHYKIFLNKRFLIAATLALILYLPHLYWLYENDFVSVQYHLFDRNRHGYRSKNHWNYLIDQIAIGGLLSPFVYWAVVKMKSKNVFEKGLKFIFFGFFLFFLLSTFQKKSQAQWVIMNVFPLVIFTFLYALEKKTFRKYLMIFGTLSLVLMTYIRFALVFPKVSPIDHEVHWTASWPKELYEKSGGKSAVFYDSYKNAALYAFYSGLDAFSLNSLYSRENQYSIDDSEEKVQGKDVMLVYTLDSLPADFSMLARRKKNKDKFFHASHFDDFESFRKAYISLHSESIGLKNSDLTFELVIGNPYNRDIHVQQSDFTGVFFNERKRVLEESGLNFSTDFPQKILLKAGEKRRIDGNVTFQKPGHAEAKFLTITFAEKGFLPGYQGEPIPIN